MKKLAILALSFATFNLFAWEVQVKGGYDFYRGNSKYDTTVAAAAGPSTTHNYSEKGFTLGLELIPFNKGVVEGGLGVEYNFATTTPFYDKEQENHMKNGYTVPLYLLGKVNMLRNAENDKALYTFGRLGYAFSAKDKDAAGFPKDGGLYYGAGFGFEIKHFVFEGIYDGLWNMESTAIHHFNHKAGIRTGFRFGDWAKKPMIVVEPILPEPPVVMPKPEPKVTKTYGRLIHATCSEEEKVCVIHGFKVDEGMPNEEEKENIKEIVALINEFSGTGYVDVIGHTDSTGSYEYNDKLAVLRAENVTKLLREAGLNPGLKVSSISGRGEMEPMATNKTKEGRYLNRRVELKFSDLLLEKLVVEEF